MNSKKFGYRLQCLQVDEPCTLLGSLFAFEDGAQLQPEAASGWQGDKT